MTGFGIKSGRRWLVAFGAPALFMIGAGGASAGVLDRLKQDKTIRLAVRDDAAPFSYKDPAGQHVGFMVDLCRGVAKEISVRLGAGLKVDYVTVTAADRFEAIETGKADLLCEPTTETLARREHVDFSIPTFVDGASLIVAGDAPQDFTALAGKKIGVLGGTTTETELRNTLKSIGMTADVVTYAAHDIGLKALIAGDVAAYFGDRSILGHVADQLPGHDKLKLATTYLSVEPYALALPHGDDEFRLAVDRGLSRIYRTGLIAQIFLATFGPNNPPTETLKTLYIIAALPE